MKKDSEREGFFVAKLSRTSFTVNNHIAVTGLSLECNPLRTAGQLI